MQKPTYAYLQIRNPNDDETPIEAATQIFSAILPKTHVHWFSQWFSPIPLYSFEIYLINKTIYYYMAIPTPSETFITSLVTSSFPQCIIQKTTDPMDIMLKSKKISIGEAGLTSSYYYPIKTYSDFSIDPLSGVIGYLAKQNTPIKLGIQILVSQASFAWQRQAIARTKVEPPKTVINPVTGEQTTTTPTESPKAALIGKKILFQGGRACIRFIASTNQPELPTEPYLQNLSGTFGTFSLAEGNQFTFRKPLFSSKKLIEKMKTRTADIGERKYQIFNAQELATLWHPPGKLLAGIRNIAWGKTLAGEPPENLPTTETVPEEEKKEVNFFAKTEFKNQEAIFGIKTPDRRKHMYIVGKTGAGKSTLIANMAIDDIRRDRGVGIIDPHGDLCETVLEYIPKRRINDVIYLEPFDDERPFSLNVLEIKNPQHRDLIASGIVAIFSKLYAESWGPRLEYILRNTIISLLELPQATLIDALNILSNEKFRKKAIEQIQDPVMVNFWTREFNAMSDKLRTEAVSPIQNKVGQFVSSKKIRNIIGNYKSTINLEEIMNTKKIILLNLSQGKLGEDNAALLGAMIITQIQLAAMNRSFIKEEERQDFFLYVDEFQNFATSSFIKILSEARKFRLALTLTNQYIEQLNEEVTHAIFGNVGTLISFVVGARDADVLTKEFSEIYTANDLVQLGKFETVMKICIDNMTSSPFPAKTLPPPSLKNHNKEKIIRLSKEKYGRKINK